MKNYIIPFVIIMASLGIFTLRFSFVDLFAMGIFGFIGFVMNRYGYPIIPAVMGAILGGIIEENFIRSLMLGEGVFIFFNPLGHPISFILVVLIFFTLFKPLAASLFNKKH